MARKHRVEHPDAWHHIMNRGARKQAVFLDRRDRADFVSLVSAAVEVFEIEVHAYCLMGNHFHLLARTPLANLGEAMQFIGSRYTQQFNRRHGVDGALFRGRYASVSVADDRHVVSLCRYIHRNPVEAGLVESALAWEWSSYRAYSGRTNPPNWLTTDLLLSLLGGVDHLEKFVEAPPVSLPLVA